MDEEPRALLVVANMTVAEFRKWKENQKNQDRLESLCRMGSYNTMFLPTGATITHIPVKTTVCFTVLDYEQEIENDNLDTP